MPRADVRCCRRTAGQVNKETLGDNGVIDLARQLKGQIGHFHLIDSDNTLHGDETSTHAPFGDGVLDFDAIIPVIMDENRLRW